MTYPHIRFNQCSSISYVFIHGINTERLPRKSVDLALASGAHDFRRLQISIMVNITTFPVSNKRCDKYLNNPPVSVTNRFI